MCVMSTIKCKCNQQCCCCGARCVLQEKNNTETVPHIYKGQYYQHTTNKHGAVQWYLHVNVKHCTESTH